MSCKSCHSENQSSFNGEIALHFPGLKGLNKPIVWVFPKLLVCLDCGFTEFAIPETELCAKGWNRSVGGSIIGAGGVHCVSNLLLPMYR